MRSVHTERSTQSHFPGRVPPGCLAPPRGTGTGVPSSGMVIAHPPSYTPLLHGHYPASSLLWARPSLHSVTKHLTRPATASPLPAQRGRLPGLLSRSGLRLLSAGSSLRAAESCSLSYGLQVRLRLLSTSHHNNAVTFGYRDRASPGGGLSPPRSRLLPGARIPASAGMTTPFPHCDPVPEGRGSFRMKTD